MAHAAAWIGRYPAVLLLLGALLVGQLLQGVSRTYVAGSVVYGEFPVVAAGALLIALLLAVVAIVARMQFGHQLQDGVHSRSLPLPASASLPPGYAVADAPAQAVASVLALIDIGLLLLIQNTVRTPVLAIGPEFVARAQAEAAFVALVVLLALLMLIKLQRTGGPVLLLLLWWGLDRVVPTAGFLGARPSVTRALTSATPPLSAPVPTPALAATPCPHARSRHRRN